MPIFDYPVGKSSERRVGDRFGNPNPAQAADMNEIHPNPLNANGELKVRGTHQLTPSSIYKQNNNLKTRDCKATNHARKFCASLKIHL